MGTAVFVRLSKYIKSVRREEFRRKIAALGIKSTSTAMLATKSFQKPPEQFLKALRVLADFYLLDHPKEARVNPDTIHLKGEVTYLLDSIGLPPRIRDVDPISEVMPVFNDTEAAEQKPRAREVFLTAEARALIEILTKNVSKLRLYLSTLDSVEPGDLHALGVIDSSLKEYPTALQISELQEKFEVIQSKYKEKKDVFAVSLSLLENRPELLQEGWLYTTEESILTFSEEPIKYLDRRYANLVPKFVKALQKGIVPPQGTEGIKMITSIPDGPNGRLFEVKLLGRGHYRLIGCFMAGVFKILRFDPSAPYTREAWDKKYGGLCK